MALFTTKHHKIVMNSWSAPNALIFNLNVYFLLNETLLTKNMCFRKDQDGPKIKNPCSVNPEAKSYKLATLCPYFSISALFLDASSCLTSLGHNRFHHQVCFSPNLFRLKVFSQRSPGSCWNCIKDQLDWQTLPLLDFDFSLIKVEGGS